MTQKKLEEVISSLNEITTEDMYTLSTADLRRLLDVLRYKSVEGDSIYKRRLHNLFHPKNKPST